MVLGERVCLDRTHTHTRHKCAFSSDGRGQGDRHASGSICQEVALFSLALSQVNQWLVCASEGVWRGGPDVLYSVDIFENEQ